MARQRNDAGVFDNRRGRPPHALTHATPNIELDPDPMTGIGGGEVGVWSLPSEPDVLDDPGAQLPPGGFDYSAGMLAGVPATEADAWAPPLSPHLIRVRTDLPASYEMPHEALHRRYEPPLLVAVNQTGAGFTLLGPPIQGLHFIKLLAAQLTLSAAGSLKFQQGGTATGVGAADLTGALAMGGAAVAPLSLPPAPTHEPWLWTSSDQGLGLFTATGLAQGWVVICYSPYES